jgi:RNA polymerase-binding transcription factor DksA
MSEFVNKAKQFADSHEEQVDQATDRVGDEAKERTGDRYDKQIDKGVQAVDQHIGDDEPQQ